MKKIGLLCLALVLALGTMGGALAYWTETLEIGQNPINTGNFIVTFCDGGGADGWTSPTTGETVHLRGVISNDDAINDHAIWCNGPILDPMVPDPDDDGTDPKEAQTMGVACARESQDVASTTVAGDGTVTMTVKIDNAYPSYWPTVFFSIRNWGTIPAYVKSIKLTKVDYDGIDISVDYALTACTNVYVDVDTGNISLTEDPGVSDLMLHVSDDEGRLYQVMEAGSGVYGDHGYFESAVCGNLDIHVLQNDENESRTMSFEITILAVPFNK